MGIRRLVAGNQVLPIVSRIVHQLVGLFLLGVFLFVDLPLSVVLHALDRGSFLLAVAERGPEAS